MPRTPPTQFRLSQGTLGLMDKLAKDHGLSNRAEVLRFALNYLAKHSARKESDKANKKT